MTPSSPREAWTLQAGAPGVALLVPGMHRSGTSAITRVLNLLGADAGPRLIPGQAGVNDGGFWEHSDAVDFHERLLRWHTLSWHDFRALPASAFDGDVARAAVDEIRALVARDFATADRWVLKDPRLSRLVPLWTQALAGSRWTPHFVLPVRHPAEVAASLERRDGMPRMAAMLLWSRHVLEAVAHTEGHPRAVSDYAQLLQDWRPQLARIAARLGLDWLGQAGAADGAIDAFLDAGSRHHRSLADAPPRDALERAAFDAYGALSDISAGRSDWAAAGPALATLAAIVDDQSPGAFELQRHAWLHDARANDAERRLAARDQVDVTALQADLARLQGLSEERDALAAAMAHLQEQSVAAQAAREAELVAARAELRRREAQLGDTAARLDLRQHEVDRLVTSRSWRITAPMRWVRARLAAIRHGRAAPRYADVLGVPTSDEGYLAVGHAAAAQAAPAPLADARAQAYLGAHFAADVDRRSPDYLPADDRPAPEPGALRAKAIAFYLPQFHPFAENEAWWGKGFTEWTNVTKAVPQFLGHDQPQLPADLGFYDLRVPDVLRRQVELARQYGLHGFAFHYYWFGGKRLMEQPLDLYLAQDDIDFPFCLCWANENWTRRWDGHDSEVLISQEHGPDNDLAFIRDLEPYLRDRRYLRVDGKPLLIVYRPSILPDARATLERWRRHCRDAGIGELFIMMAQFDAEDPREWGFDAAVEFPPHKLAKGFDAINGSLEILNPAYQGHVVHYQSIVDSAKAWPDRGFPLVRTVFPGWDNEARRPGKGYTFAYATPDRYRDWLGFAVEHARAHPVGGEPIVMINAWNEWAEGAKLEPDRRHGHAFLRATREVLEGRVDGRVDDESGRTRIVVVAHDAHPHGAQYLSLNLCRELVRMGFAVDAVLLGDGSLLPEFAATATVHRVHDAAGAEGEALAQRLHAGGARHAIANSAVSGALVPALARAGLAVVGLVHELPGVIAQFGLQGTAAGIARHARHVVFAARAVQQGFEQVAPLPPGKARLRPQGVYKHNRYRSDADRALARREIRLSLGASPSARVLLAVGYADHRKGADLFVEAAAQLAAQDPGFHAVWLGHGDAALEPALRARIAALGLVDRIHFPGRTADTDAWYAGADLLALTSREDPFPSVVMESLDVGVPVVAFANTGGAEELISRGAGRMVATLDATAFAQACADLLADDAGRAALGRTGQALVEAEFSFRKYVFDLLDMTGLVLPRVSVVVPNYNYGHLIGQRLRSIAAQTVPYYELIVLDDASTDDSLAKLAALRGGIEMSLLANQGNSGSVFRQWARGVAAATGGFVWIAEADDLAEPGFLEEALRGFADPTVVMSYTQSQQMGPAGEVLAPDYLEYTRDLCAERWTRPFVADGAEEVASGLGVKNTIPNVSAVLFRREPLASVLAGHLEQAAGYRVAGDWVVYLNLLTRGRLAFSPRVLNRHRRHAESVTVGSDSVSHLREVIRVQQLALALFDVPAARQEAAREYAQSLYRQFALAPEATSELARDARFVDLFA